MATVTEICNIALSRIGVSRFIDNIDESSVEAMTCKVHYNNVISSIFRKDYFPSLQVMKPLALIDEAPNERWAYAYQYPADCARFRGFVVGTNYAAGRLNAQFERGIHNGADVIFTDLDSAVAAYQVLPDTLDETLGSMVAWRLAAEIALPLAVEQSRRSDAMQMFQIEKSQCMATELNESYHEPVDSEFINVRGLD